MSDHEPVLNLSADDSDSPGDPVPRKRSGLKLALIVVPLALLGLVLLIAAAGFVFEMTKKSVPVTAEDRSAIVDAKRVADRFEGIEVQADLGKYEKFSFLDGSEQLQYEYLADDLIVECTISTAKSATEASAEYAVLWTSVGVGLKIGGGESTVELEERNELFKWGDASRVGIIKHNGQPTGIVIIARKGNTVVMLLISGVHFDDAETLGELLKPHAEAWDRR